MSSESLAIEAWACSDVGRVRKHNEDSYLIDKELGLFAVADGMGGFKRGDVASGLACSVLRETIAAGRHAIHLHLTQRNAATTAAVEALLRNAVQRACEEIYQASTALTGDGGRMGTTFDAVLLVGAHAFTAHVGDGRIYLIRNEEAHQVTEDHSLVQQQVREGLITPEQARRARNKNVITRALGVFPSVMVDCLHLELDAGDRLVLCSDGLHNYVGAEELVRPIRTGSNGGVEDLVSIANLRGGRDNITGLVLAVDAGTDARAPRGGPAVHIDTLRRCDLFSFCTYKELVQVSGVCETRQVPAHTVLFKEDDIGRECYIIAGGEVEILRGGVSLAVIGPPSYFGEMAFIDSPRRSATVVTKEDSRFLIISRNDFLRLVRQDSTLATKLMWRLLHNLARMVRTTNTKVVAGAALVDSHTEEILKES